MVTALQLNNSQIYNNIITAADIRLKLRSIYSNDFLVQVLTDRIKTLIPGVSKVTYNPITYRIDIKFRKKVSLEDTTCQITNVLFGWLSEKEIASLVLTLIKSCNIMMHFDYYTILSNTITGLFNFVLTSENTGTIYL